MRFFDSYAIIAILMGRPGYVALQGEPGVTHHMNLLEALVGLIRLGIERPMERLEGLGLPVVPATRADLLFAARLKTSPEGSRRKLSLVDALGYAIAQRLDHAFLTGDRGFEGMAGVEFVPQE